MTKEADIQVDMSPFSDKTYVPTLHDVFLTLGQKIVGEEESRLALFTNWILARKYCMVTGPSRGGKTFVVDAVKTLVLGDTNEGGLCYVMKQGSDKSGWYAAEEMNKSSFVIIPELNQLPLDMMEVLKTWGENKSAQYSVVERKGGRKVNEKHTLSYKPFVFAIADENNMSIPAELRYRLIEIRIDGSQEQTARIIKKQAETELNPFKFKKDDDIPLNKNLQKHIEFLPPFESWQYVNPLATFVASKVPKSFTDARTAHTVFQDGIKGLQRFYWKQSMVKEVNGKKVLFISPQAIMENYIINGRIFLNSVLKCNDVELEMLNVLKNETRFLSRKEIATKLRALSLNLRDSVVQKHLNNLEEMNYVNVSTSGTKFYQISDALNIEGFNIKGEDLIASCKAVMEEVHPEYFDEYVETYLDKPTFIHPFTGKVVDLRTFELGTEPKRMKKETLEIEKFTDETGGITEEVILEELEESSPLSEWLESGEKMYVVDFIDKFGQEKYEELKESGEVFNPEVDTVIVLR